MGYILYPFADENHINHEEQKYLRIFDLGQPGTGAGHKQILVLMKQIVEYDYYE